MRYLLCCFRGVAGLSGSSPPRLVTEEDLLSDNIKSSGLSKKSKAKNHATFVRRKCRQPAPLGLEELPEPCLERILSFVAVNERVRLFGALSWKWKNLVEKSLIQLSGLGTKFHQGTKFSSGQPVSDTATEPGHCEYSRTEFLSGSDPVAATAALTALLPRCPNLRTLILREIIVDPRLRDAITLNCPELEVLEVARVTFVDIAPSDFLRQVFVYATKTRTLSISGFSETDMALAASFLSGLRELTVRFAPLGTEEETGSCFEPSHGLARATVKPPPPPPSVALIGGNLFSKLDCPLRNLVVEGINEMYPAALVKNPRLRASLVQLVLKATPISFATLKALCKAYPALRTLQVELKGEPSFASRTLFGKISSSNNGTTSPASGLHELKVSIFGADKVNQSNFKDWPDFSLHNVISVLKNTPELRHLSLSGGFLSNESIRKISRHCPHLEHLELLYINKDIIKRNADITDLGAQDIGVALAGSLRSLGLPGSALSDTGLASLMSSCKGLRVLDLSGCERLSHSSLEVLKEVATRSLGDQFLIEALGTQLHEPRVAGDDHGHRDKEEKMVRETPANLKIVSAPGRRLSSSVLLARPPPHLDDRLSQSEEERDKVASGPTKTTSSTRPGHNFNYFSLASRLLRIRSQPSLATGNLADLIQNRDAAEPSVRGNNNDTNFYGNGAKSTNNSKNNFD